MHEVKVSLSKPQIHKAIRGHPIQLHASQVQGGAIRLVLHHENAKKVHRAKRGRKGTRLHLSPEEIHASGLMDILKKGVEFIREKILPTAKRVYEPLKPILAPLIKQGVEAAVQTGISRVGAKYPGAANVASQLAPAVVEQLGQRTGAYGLRRHMLHGAGITNTMSPILSPLHPSMMSQKSRPPAPSQPPPGGFGMRHHSGYHGKGHRGGRRGGSFLAI